MSRPHPPAVDRPGDEGRAARFESALPYVWVRDLARAQRYYTETLGFEVAYEAAWEENGKEVRVVGVQRGATRFELSICGCADHGHDGKAYFGVQVDDVSALHAEYSARGVAVTCELRTDEGEVSRFTIDDPDGNRVHFFAAW